MVKSRILLIFMEQDKAIFLKFHTFFFFLIVIIIFYK
jgi:hypothetical protein